MSYLLYIEVRLQNRSVKKRPLKIVIMALMLTFEFIVFLRYFFKVNKLRMLLSIIQSTLSGTIHLFICFYFLKSSSKLLSNRLWWLRVTKLVGVIMAIFYVIIIILQAISEH